MRNIIKHDIRTSMNERMNERTNTLLYRNISLTLYSRKGDVCCVWEMSWRRRQTAILTQFSCDHSSTSSSSWLGLLNRGSLRAQRPLSAAGSHFGILSPTDSNRLCTWLYYCLRPPASAVLPLIYTGASLDWRLGRGSIYNNNYIQNYSFDCTQLHGCKYSCVF